MDSQSVSSESDRSVDLLIFSSDHELINTVATASGGRHTLRLAATAQALQENLTKHKDTIGVVIIDLMTISPDHLLAANKILATIPSLIGILISKKGALNKLSKPVNIPIQHCGLKRDFSKEEGHQVIEAAVKKYHEQMHKPRKQAAKTGQAAGPAVAKPAHTQAHASSTASSGADAQPVSNPNPGANKAAGKLPIFKITMIGVPVLVVIVAGVYVLMNQSSTRREPAAVIDVEAVDNSPSESVQKELVEDSYEHQISSLLARANAAIQYGEYIEPEKISANHYYSQALELEPDNENVKQAINNFIDLVIREVNNYTSNYKLQQASNTVEAIRPLQPNDPRFASFDKRFKTRVNETIAHSKQVAARGDVVRAKEMLSEAAAVLSVDLEVLLSLNSQVSGQEKKQQRIDGLVGLISDRLSERKLVLPEKDNAKYYLMTLRALSPDNGALKLGFDQLGRGLLERTDTSIKQGKLEQAARWLKELRIIGGLEDKVSRRNIALNEALQKQRVAIAGQKRETRIRELIADINSQIATGDFFEPSDKNASRSLALLTEIARDEPRTAAAVQRFNEALAGDIRHLLELGDYERVSYLLEKADTPAFRNQREALKAELYAAMDKSSGEPLNPAETGLQRASLNTTGRARKSLSAPISKEARTEDFVKPIKLVRSVSPEYPDKAIRRNQEGWVHLAFNVNGKGRTSDIEILNSEPRRIFDKSARKAVSKFRYEIIEEGVDLDNFNYREEIRLRFKLQ